MVWDLSAAGGEYVSYICDIYPYYTWFANYVVCYTDNDPVQTIAWYKHRLSKCQKCENGGL